MRNWLLGIVLPTLLVIPVRAGEQDEALREALRGLEHSMEVLRELGHLERVEMLERLARDIREHMGRRGEGGEERGHRERDVAINQIELMRMALPALLEAGRRDSAELVERAIRAREVRLEGRRDRVLRRRGA